MEEHAKIFWEAIDKVKEEDIKAEENSLLTL